MAVDQVPMINSAFFRSNGVVTRDNLRFYLCRNTTDSISFRRLNDGYIDCLYGDDERNDQYNPIQPYRYRCETVLLPHQYVSYQQLGNGIKNCLDGSDEISLKVRWSSMKCDIDENFSCWLFQGNGIDEDRISTVQLPYHQHCDTIWDTMNGEDEKNCSHWICAQNAYRCNRTGQCIYQTYFCDGEFDCDDGEDELNCSLTSRQWTFEEICDRTDEHFCITQEYLEDPLSRRPCISYVKAGDGHMDCLGGRDERNVFSCSDHQMLGDRFLCDNQSKCLDYTVICDGIDHCLDRTDELICHWNRSSCSAGYFACKNGTVACKSSRCILSDRCSDKSHLFWCPISTSKNSSYRATKHQNVLNYEQSCYQQSLNRQVTQSVKTVSTDIQTVEVFTFPLYGYCNRGFYLTSSNGSQPLCFCPPSYYGNRCQYDSRRVTVRFRFDRRHRFDIPVVLSVLVSLIYNESEIIDHQFVFDINQNSPVKYNMYLLYPRPRPRGLYFVRFEVYHTTSFLAAWQYKISPFDFLPVYRLAKVLRFPVAILPVLCPAKPCQNHGTCYLMNENQFLCLCSREWHGSFCEKPLMNVTCAGHSLARDRNVCICPYGYLQPRCFVRSLVCEHSSPCPGNSECYALSEQPPNRYWCLCDGLMCNVRDALLTIHRNQSNSLPYLVQLLKIRSDYPSVRQQILVHPLTNFPMHARMQVRDPRNIKEYLPEIALLFTFEPHKRSVSIILHLLYINCSTTFRNLSVDLDRQPSRCQSLLEREIPSIKSLKLFCQKTQRDDCFLVNDYLCWCNSSMLPYTECISYHQRQTTCDHCYNQGRCVRGDLYNQSDFTCVCPKCTSGVLCQFSPSDFSISFEYLFVKTQWKRYHFIVPSLFLLFGMIFNSLCVVTFIRPQARQKGSGVYLLINSITGQLIFVTLLIRIIYLYMIDQFIFNKPFNRILCKSLPYVMFSLNYVSLWLMCFVTVERAVAALFLVRFRSFGKPRSAVLLSVLMSTCVFASMYPHLIQYKLIIHPNDHHPWCIRENESYEKSPIQHISLFHQISPFCINILGALTIIITTSRSKAHIHHLPTRNTLQQQARQRKDLLLGPLICFVAQLPQIIILSLDICLYEQHRWFSHFTLLAYYISFLPQMILFFLYVLPSPLYRKLLVTETTIGKRIISTMFPHTETN